MSNIGREKRTRAMIHAGRSNDEIIEKTKQTNGTIDKIRRTIEVNFRLCSGTREKIFAMLIAGFSARQIEYKLMVEHDDVIAVRRFYYVECLRTNRKEVPKVCELCHKELFTCDEETANDDDCEPDVGTYGDEPESTRILMDIVSLNRLGVVVSPLFSSIARRALHEIRNGKTEDTADGGRVSANKQARSAYVV